MLVVDASATLRAVIVDRGFAPLARERLIAPPLMWSEVESALHESVWRREITAGDGFAALGRLMDAPIRRRAPRALAREAWAVAEALGWAKTCDAEFVALARLSRCPLLTADARLRKGAARLVEVLGPAEI